MQKMEPNSVETEQAILALILSNPSSFLKIKDSLEVDDFFSIQNKTIYTAMLQLNNSSIGVDLTTLSTHLNETNKLMDAGGLEYLVSLTDSLYSKSNVDSYIKIVKDKTTLRNLIGLSRDIIDKSYTPANNSVESILEHSEQSIMKLGRTHQTTELKTMSTVMNNILESIEIRSKVKQGGLTGLDTGFERLNKITLGLQKDDLIILAARPAMGKTAFAVNLAQNVAMLNNNATIAFFSLEMGAEQLAMRMLSLEAQVNSHFLKTANLTPEQKNAMNYAADSLSNLNIYFDDSPGIKISDIKSKSRKLHSELKLDLIIIDYLQLITSNNHRGNRQQEVSEISRSLKELARELKIPVISLSQLSRGVESREDKRPVMSDLRESGSIEQDADIVMFLYRDEYYNPDSEKKNIMEVIIQKHRHGETGNIELGFQLDIGKLRNISYTHTES